VRLSGKSGLREVAAAVGQALDDHGIRAVLTGGACAALYTGGRFPSFDLDFIIVSGAILRDLDTAMEEAGFTRKGDHYAHPGAQYIVEFPRGPLGVGSDLDVRPVGLKISRTKILALSPTDSCRDRLAAFYFWGDRQSLRTAVEIAKRHRVRMKRIEEWSLREGFKTAFEEFRSLLQASRRSR
jgi:hypothetical protein